MHLKQSQPANSSLTCGSDAEPFVRWLHDCWMIEVMPPTWVWAYRRLLNPHEPHSRYGGDRLP